MRQIQRARATINTGTGALSLKYDDLVVALLLYLSHVRNLRLSITVRRYHGSQSLLVREREEALLNVNRYAIPY